MRYQSFQYRMDSLIEEAIEFIESNPHRFMKGDENADFIFEPHKKTDDRFLGIMNGEMLHQDWKYKDSGNYEDVYVTEPISGAWYLYITPSILLEIADQIYNDLEKED